MTIKNKITPNFYDRIYFVFLRFARLFFKEKLSDTSSTVASSLLAITESVSIICVFSYFQDQNIDAQSKEVKGNIFFISGIVLLIFNFVYFGLRNRSYNVYLKLRNESNIFTTIVVTAWVITVLWLSLKE